MECDYLSLSFYPPQALEMLFDVRCRDKPIARFWGYEGFREKTENGSLFWGEKRGRHLVVASSALAQQTALFLLSFALEDEKCNRLDMQHSQVVQNCDERINFLADIAMQSKFVVTHVRSSDDAHSSGATLYVGSAASDRRLRIYNKSAQMHAGEYGEDAILRVEMVLRNKFSAHVWRIARSRSFNDASQVVQKWAIRMLPEIAMFVDLSSPSVEFKVGVREKSYRNWIEHVVKPALCRAAHEDVEVVLELGRFVSDLLTIEGKS